MQAEGMESLFPMDELSVMGIAEVLPKYRHLKRRMHQTAEAVIAAAHGCAYHPSTARISCLRVAKEVKAKSDLRIVHYVAPLGLGMAAKNGRRRWRVWSIRCSRSCRLRPPYLEAVGLRCDFVGHPVVSEPVASDAEVAMFRGRAGNWRCACPACASGIAAE